MSRINASVPRVLQELSVTPSFVLRRVPMEFVQVRGNVRVILVGMEPVAALVSLVIRVALDTEILFHCR